MKIKRAYLTKPLYALPLIIIAAAIIAQPQKYINLCYEGIAMWAVSVLPSLFPFMVISSLLIKLGAVQAAARPFRRAAKAFKMPSCAPALFFISLCSGYPAGSRLVAQFCKDYDLPASDAAKLGVLCSTSGPLFIIGTVGVKAFSNNMCGFIIFISHALSVFVSSIIYAALSKKTSFSAPLKKQENGNILYDSFYGAVTAVLIAGAFITFFHVAGGIANDLYILRPINLVLSPILGGQCAQAVAEGLIEATGACFALGEVNSPLSLALAGFLITFGGLSILLQQLCYLKACGVKTPFFIGFKFLQGLLCGLLCYLASTFL